MSKPIRVLCVFSTLDRGGAESMCMNLYRHVNHERVQFDFVKHTMKKGAFEDEIISLGGRVYQAPRFKGYNLLQYDIWWRNHLRLHPEHHIIHGHFFTISPIYFNIAHSMERVTVGHIHASTMRGKGKQLLVKLIERKADYCLACSEEAGKWAYPHRKFHVLNNALDLKKFTYNSLVREKYRKEFGFNDEYVLGTVANFSRVKNPFGLLEIFKTVHECNSNTRLLWVGEGGLRQEIEKQIKVNSLEGQVLLLGTRDDVPELLQCMDCFLLPSFNEGLPVSAIEAQASGLHCFISDSITKDVDLTGLCRFLSINNYESWKEAILMSDKTRFNTEEYLKASGYNIEYTSQWIESFYLKVFKHRGQ